MMHRFIYVLFIFIAFCAHARTLHVGDSTIKLSQTKTTTPALHIKVDGEIWYGNMCTNFNTNSLHIKYNGTVYDVIEPFTDTTNYTYDENGRLIAANENIYLESTGTQWIDTLYIPHNTSKFVTTVQLIGQTNVSLFGTTASATQGNRIQLYISGIGYYAFRLAYTDAGFDSSITGYKKAHIIYDIHNRFFSINDWDFFQNFTLPEFTNTLVLYGQKYGTNQVRTLSESRFYNFLVYEEDTLVRHFVPVPCGLQIGDFVVPSNGMWDIVEQKFYGNMGSGDFIYGIDE